MSSGKRPRRWRIVRTPLLVWVALLVLLTITAVAAFQPLGVANVVVSMTIGVAKALLIVLFFMRLASSNRTIILASFAGPAFLLILFLLAFADFANRPPW